MYMQEWIVRGLRASALVAFAGVTFAGATSANASFMVLVTESGGPTIPIVDDGPLDNNTTNPGVINVNTGALNSLLVNFSFSSLGSTSNRLLGTPLSNNPASLSQTGGLTRTTTIGTFSITITAADSSYLFPSGNPKTMSTSASDTFAFVASGSSRTFQSLFDPSNTDPAVPGTLSPLLAFIPPVGIGPFSTSNPGVSTPLGTQPTPFSLSNTTVITLPPGSVAQQPSDQFTGMTIVTAVPEPATCALLFAGIGALAIRRRRHES
jgi:hypothetical protein